MGSKNERFLSQKNFSVKIWFQNMKFQLSIVWWKWTKLNIAKSPYYRKIIFSLKCILFLKNYKMRKFMFCWKWREKYCFHRFCYIFQFWKIYDNGDFWYFSKLYQKSLVFTPLSFFYVYRTPVYVLFGPKLKNFYVFSP